MGLLNSCTGAVVEGFMNPSGAEVYRPMPVYADAIAAVLGFVLSVIIVSFIGLWLWNYSVVPLFEFARPARSVFQILGLMVFIALIHG
jgi:type IV secretory pathway TrbD component